MLRDTVARWNVPAGPSEYIISNIRKRAGFLMGARSVGSKAHAGQTQRRLAARSNRGAHSPGTAVNLPPSAVHLWPRAAIAPLYSCAVVSRRTARAGSQAGMTLARGLPEPRR